MIGKSDDSVCAREHALASWLAVGGRLAARWRSRWAALEEFGDGGGPAEVVVRPAMEARSGRAGSPVGGESSRGEGAERLAHR